MHVDRCIGGLNKWMNGWITSVITVTSSDLTVLFCVHSVFGVLFKL